VLRRVHLATRLLGREATAQSPVPPCRVVVASSDAVRLSRRPNTMVGSVLYPLRELQRAAPDAFALQASKYVNREAVLEACITSAGLRFNDTIHCAPLHPHHLYRLRLEMDLLPLDPEPGATARWSPGRFFEIPLDRILGQPTFWYRWLSPWINGYPGTDVPLAPPLDEFEAFDSGRYRELTEVPRRHVEYLQKIKHEGGRGLMFVHIPHVLVAGTIETRGLRVVSWEQPPQR